MRGKRLISLIKADVKLGMEIPVCSNQLTIIPVVTAIPRPQYVLGTMSPKPTLKKVIAINHMEFSKLACSSSWNLEQNDKTPKILERNFFCEVHVNREPRSMKAISLPK